MKRIKLALNLRDLDPSGVELYAHTIYMALTNNPHFTGMAPHLLLLSAGIGDLRAAIISSVYSSVVVRHRVQYIEKVLNVIKSLVELECDDQEEKALSSGFTLKKNHGTRPKRFEVRQGMLSGTVDLVCPYAGPRVAYIWEITTDASMTSGWTQFRVSTTTATQISGLNPGTKYWFRVKAIVNDEEQRYSDPRLVHVV